MHFLTVIKFIDQCQVPRADPGIAWGRGGQLPQIASEWTKGDEVTRKCRRAAGATGV